MKPWTRYAMIAFIGAPVLFIAQSHATAGTPSGQTAGASPQATTKVSIRAQDIDCPSGLERFLPGIYYYCVGARREAQLPPKPAIEMLKTAASWGSKPAQFLLGLNYYKGEGVAQDRVQGLAWLGLAAERGDPTYLAVFRSAWFKASPAEQAQADQLWNALKPRYADAVAAHRAEQRYLRARRELVRNEVYGAQVCIAGLTSQSVVPTHSIPGAPPDGCVGSIPVELAAQKVDNYAAYLFQGYQGHVLVGTPEPVAPPATAAGAARH